MDFLELLKERYHIDIIIVLMVFLSGYFQKSYLCGVRISLNDHNDAMYKTLLLSGVVSGIYIWLVYIGDKTAILPYMTYFISYFAATSLYEMAVKPVTAWFNRNIRKVTK